MAATSAALFRPQGIATDGPHVYIADMSNHRIRIVTGGNISTFAGPTGTSPTSGYSGDGGAPTAPAARFNFPRGVALFGGTVYIEDTNDRIRSVANGTLSAFAGSGASGDGGLATNAVLSKPNAAVYDSTGNLYVADGEICACAALMP